MSVPAADILEHPAVAWTCDTLRFGDTDRNGHINNGTFAALAESGRVQLIDRSLASHLPPAAFFVVGRLTMEFHAELHFPGRLRTATWISRIGPTSLTMQQALLRDAPDDDDPRRGPGSLSAPVATCEAVCVLVDGATRRPLTLPDDARQAVVAMLVPASPPRG